MNNEDRKAIQTIAKAIAETDGRDVAIEMAEEAAWDLLPCPETDEEHDALHAEVVAAIEEALQPEPTPKEAAKKQLREAIAACNAAGVFLVIADDDTEALAAFNTSISEARLTDEDGDSTEALVLHCESGADANEEDAIDWIG